MLFQLTAEADKISSWEYKNSLKEFGAVVANGLPSSPAGFS